MKRNISSFFSIFAFLVFAVSFTFANPKETIISQTQCEFKEVQLFDNQFKNIISFDEFQSDVENLCYIIQTGYAGYEDMIGRGFSTDSFKNFLFKSFENQTEIETRQFYNKLIEALSPYVQDAHFSLIYFSSSENFCKKSIVYWSNVFVQKRDDKFIVCESNERFVPKGTEYSDSLENLFYYPAKGENVYRIGLLSYKKISSEYFDFGGTEVALKLYDDGAIGISPSMKFDNFETENSAYISVKSFSDLENPDVLEKFVQCGEKYRDKKNIILDLRANQNQGGGDEEYSAAFFYELYYDEKFSDLEKIRKKVREWTRNSFEERKNVYSPISVFSRYLYANSISDKKMIRSSGKEVDSMRKEPSRIVTKTVLKDSKYFNDESSFKGKLIILIDRNSVSAAESSVTMAKTIFGDENVLVVGENSYGMALFLDFMTLKLPFSGIGIQTAFEKNLQIENAASWHGEGFGIYPDFWAAENDLNQTIFMITNDNEMKVK